MAERDNVIVVGAGPVGFLAALGLAQRGIEVTVIDAEPGVIRSPRAAVYFHTTHRDPRHAGPARGSGSDRPDRAAVRHALPRQRRDLPDRRGA